MEKLISSAYLRFHQNKLKFKRMDKIYKKIKSTINLSDFKYVRNHTIVKRMKT